MAERAKTNSGQWVRLDPDGTWSYEEQSTPPADADGFRRIPWGSSPDEVLELERGAEFVTREGDILGYAGEVMNLPCSILFVFVNDKLFQGTYSFKQEHTNDNEYLADFLVIDRLLRKKYGDPKHEGINWQPGSSRDTDDHGWAIAKGELNLVNEWETALTQISLGIFGDNYEISLILEYKCRTLSEVARDQQEQNDLDLL